MEDIQNIMQRLSEEKEDLYEDEVDVTTSDSPARMSDNSDVDVEDVAPPPPPARENKRTTIPGLEPTPSTRESKRSIPGLEPLPSSRESKRTIPGLEPTPPPRENKRPVSGHEPAPKRAVRNHTGSNGAAVDSIPMLGEAHPPPPPAPRASSRRSSSNRGDNPGMYDPNRGFL